MLSDKKLSDATFSNLVLSNLVFSNLVLGDKVLGDKVLGTEQAGTEQSDTEQSDTELTGGEIPGVNLPALNLLGGKMRLAVFLPLVHRSILGFRGRIRFGRRRFAFRLGLGISTGGTRFRFFLVCRSSLLVGLASIIGFVKARSLEHDRRSCSKQPPQLVLLALGAFFDGILGDRLEQLHFVSASVAFIIISWHVCVLDWRK